MTVSSKQGEFLSPKQKSTIRYAHPGASDTSLARKYGVKVATIRLVRNTGQRDHPARAINRFTRFTNAIKRITVAATQVRQPGPNGFTG